MFKLSADIDKKERSVVALRDFKGLDTVHSPMNITYQHAIDMRNLINRDGVNRKRYGWRQEKAFDSEASPAGTWSGALDFSTEQDGSDVRNIVLHIYYKSGTLSAKMLDQTNNEEKAVTISKTEDETFTEGEFKFAYTGNYLIAVGCGTVLCSIIVIQGVLPALWLYTYNEMLASNMIYPANAWSLGAVNEIGVSTTEKGLESNAIFSEFGQYQSDFYPTPSEENNYGKDYENSTVCDNNVDFENVTDEKLNALTKRERCTARFSITDEEIEDASTDLHPDNPPSSWHQYQKIFRINDMVAYNTDYYDLDDLPTEVSVAAGTDSSLSDFVLRRSTYYSSISIYVYINGSFYKQIGLTERKTSIFVKKSVFTSDDDDIVLYFIGKNLVVNANSFMFLDIDGQQVYDVELQIEFMRRNAELSDGIRQKFQNSTMVTLFGPEGVPNRLMFCDGKNTILYSENVNASQRYPLYIGSQNTITLGNTPITGWIKGTETSLYVFKKYSRREENLYIIDGELITSEDNQYNVDAGEVVFQNKGYSLPESCVNQDCACSLANDVLIVSDDGVYGVTLSANVASAERFARSRAEQIKNRLKEYDLTKAKCVVWDNKMFLAVDGLVFVADARFRATFDGDMADTFNYEWWLWDNIPVKYWTVIDEKLCFLTSDNRLCSFYDGFADYTFDDLLVAVLDEGGITISRDFADYNKIRLNAAYRACIAPEKIDQIVAGALVLDTDVLYTSINEGDTVFFDVTAGSLSVYPVSLSSPYTVTEIDIITGQVKFADADGTAVAFTAGMNALLTANPLRISKAASEQYDMKIDGAATENNALITDADGNAVQFITYNGTSSYSATVYKYAPVVAYWQTGSYDFGTSMYAKTIERFSVAFDRESPKKMKLFYRTANRGDMNLIKDLQKQKDFDFDELSFLLFTFNNRFESSYSRKLLIRNFNFIAFRILSDEAEDFSLDSLNFVYKINKLNRGEH